MAWSTDILLPVNLTLKILFAQENLKRNFGSKYYVRSILLENSLIIFSVKSRLWGKDEPNEIVVVVSEEKHSSGMSLSIGISNIPDQLLNDNVKSINNIIIQMINCIINQGNDDAEQSCQVKRKRGRPRKYKLDVDMRNKKV